MNQPTTPNTVEDFLPLPTPSAYGYKGIDGHDPDNGHKLLIGLSVQPGGSLMREREVKLYTADQVRAAILADRANRSPTLAGSVDSPKFEGLLGNLIDAISDMETSQPYDIARGKLIGYINAYATEAVLKDRASMKGNK